tara:strand:- start:71 stop:892 length:822 start_codon:yes stop_codon:yes gene_type:complete
MPVITSSQAFQKHLDVGGAYVRKIYIEPNQKVHDRFRMFGEVLIPDSLECRLLSLHKPEPNTQISSIIKDIELIFNDIEFESDRMGCNKLEKDLFEWAKEISNKQYLESNTVIGHGHKDNCGYSLVPEYILDTRSHTLSQIKDIYIKNQPIEKFETRRIKIQLKSSAEVDLVESSYFRKVDSETVEYEGSPVHLLEHLELSSVVVVSGNSEEATKLYDARFITEILMYLNILATRLDTGVQMAEQYERNGDLLSITGGFYDNEADDENYALKS